MTDPSEDRQLTQEEANANIDATYTDWLFGDLAEKPHNCWQCVHFQGLGRCEAFSKRIPLEFIFDLEKHTEPHPDDNGIQWEAGGPGVEHWRELNAQAARAQLEAVPYGDPELRRRRILGDRYKPPEEVTGN